MIFSDLLGKKLLGVCNLDKSWYSALTDDMKECINKDKMWEHFEDDISVLMILLVGDDVLTASAYLLIHYGVGYGYGCSSPIYKLIEIDSRRVIIDDKYKSISEKITSVWSLTGNLGEIINLDEGSDLGDTEYDMLLESNPITSNPSVIKIICTTKIIDIKMNLIKDIYYIETIWDVI